MRSDYGLYGIAIICFLLAAVFAAGMIQGYELTGANAASGIAVTVVFLLIGVTAAAVGYSARPRVMMPRETTLVQPRNAPISAPTTAAEEPDPAVPPPPPQPPVKEDAVSPETSPPQPSEPTSPLAASTETTQTAPAEGVTEEKPKRTRRRRKKVAA